MNHTARLSAAGCTAALLLTGLVGTSQAAPTGPGDNAHPSRLLGQAARGTGALAELGGAIPEAAARNDMSPADLSSLLRSDPTAWLDRRGQVYYVDTATGSGPSRVPARAPYDYAETFALHSNPDSSRTIFLDFDGQTVSGTAWNQGADGVGTGRQPAFDTDGTPGTFSQDEKDRVQSIWQRVSEDFAPFDVDVTTEDPGADGLRRTGQADTSFGMRALITPSEAAANAICGQGCGGVAYLNVFDRVDDDPYYQPAWVFPNRLRDNDPKAVAEAVSHEVGHTLGLDHDGFGNEQDGYGYYSGHGAWAPIMGVSYNRPISQWSVGEFGTGTNTEDDVAVMTGNGVSIQPDDAGDDTGSAAVLDGERQGLIASRTDVDYYATTRDCTDPMILSATPAPTAPNLDISLKVFGPDGVLVDAVNPLSDSVDRDTATGLAASVTSTVPLGTSYVEVAGVGERNPASDGYSDYGSLGRYTLAVTGCGTEPPAVPPGTPAIGTAKAGAKGGKVNAVAAWTAPSSSGTSPITGYRVTALRMSASGAVLSTSVSAPRPASSRSFVMPLSTKGKYRFTVAAVSSAGSSPASARSNQVAGR